MIGLRGKVSELLGENKVVSESGEYGKYGEGWLGMYCPLKGSIVTMRSANQDTTPMIKRLLLVNLIDNLNSQKVSRWRRRKETS